MPEEKIAGFEKKTVLIVVIIVVVVIGGYYFATHGKKKKGASSKANAKATYVEGTLTAENASSLTIKLADGTTQTVAVDATTRMSKKDKKMQVGNIPVGDQVKVKVSGTGANLTAVVVEDTSTAVSKKKVSGTSATAAPAATSPTTTSTIPAAPATGATTPTAPATGTTAPASTPTAVPAPTN